MALKSILLVDSAGALVGHQDDLPAAQALADDIALASGKHVKVYREISDHAPRVFAVSEEAEQSAEGVKLVEIRRQRAKDAAKVAGEDVTAAVKPEKPSK